MLNRIKDIIYNLTCWLARMGSRQMQANKVLLVRVDEIGDYMLWRPLIPELRAWKKLAGKEITLCGNNSWRSLFEQLDSEFFDTTIWLDKTRFKSDILYRYHFLRKIYKAGFSIVINPTYSRDKRNDDAIVLAAQSPENIGMVANKENWRTYDEGYDRGMYHTFWEGPVTPIFEMERNRQFIAYISGNQILNLPWQIPDPKLPPLSFQLPEKFVVIFPGSRSKNRIWPAEYFAAVATYIRENTELSIVICGGNADKIYAFEFTKVYSGEVLDVTGKTRLPELLTILHRATALITVDTGSVHLAAAVGCKVFGIFNGSQYGRFAPYPKELAKNMYSAYPDEILSDLNDEKVIIKKYLFVVPNPYSLVTPKQIINLIKENL